MRFRRYVWAGVTLAAVSGCSPDVDELKRGDTEILAKIDAVQKSLEQARGAGAKAAAEPTPDPSKVYDIPLEKSPVRGPKNAPVTIVEFSDFQCPFCAEAKPLLEQVLKAYPDDVKLVFKQFPLSSIHDNDRGRPAGSEEGVDLTSAARGDHACRGSCPGSRDG